MDTSKVIKAVALTNLLLTSAFAQAAQASDDQTSADDGRVLTVSSPADDNPQHNACCGGATCNGSC